MKSLRTVSIAGSFVALSIAAYFITGTSAGSAPSIPTARAANNSCAIAPKDLDAVGKAQAESIAAELAVRRTLLTRVIACLKADTQSLRADLASIPALDDAKSIATQLAGKLDDAMTYYDLGLTKVSDAGVEGTKAVAREIIAWREANYAPIAGQVVNLTLWARSQNLFAIANARARQMRSLVSFLEQAAQNQDLEAATGSAESIVQKADDQNQAAKNALLQFLPPDQSLVLIQQSLASLADAYQKFFDVSTIAQKLLSAKAQ